jgi:hypothetical protein
VRYALAVFLVALGLACSVWALFLAMGFPGFLLAGGLLTAAAGLLCIPVDRSNR